MIRANDDAEFDSILEAHKQFRADNDWDAIVKERMKNAEECRKIKYKIGETDHEILHKWRNFTFKEAEKEFQTDAKCEMNLIKAYPKITYQEILGMGGALTESAAYTYAQMSPEKQKELLDLYFGKNGNRYNFGRVHIQSCDFALGNYAYVEDETDKELKTFSIERDKEYILPLIHAAKEQEEELTLLASPWSPPAFMKTNGEMNHGGKLKKEYYGMWADMVAHYVTEYKKQGVSYQQAYSTE